MRVKPIYANSVALLDPKSMGTLSQVPYALNFSSIMIKLLFVVIEEIK